MSGRFPKTTPVGNGNFMDFINTSLEDKTLVVSIDRPEKHNALNDGVLDALRDTFLDLQDNEKVSGIIITGKGTTSFAAGADIHEMSEYKLKSGERASQKGQGIFSMIEMTGKPVIAAVEGYALGGGCELAMACHLRVAGRSASFGFPELGLGMIPAYGGTQRLPRMIGKGRALELILDGSPIDAQKALDIGLVNRVVEDGKAVEESLKWMNKILIKGPVAIKRAIQAVHSAFPNRAHGFHEEARLFGIVCGTDDYKEGARAFIEKRKPGFKNK
ncbi:enoyl-CoA hydratase-related protein [Balneolaceae bacterium ANBcel3]|nr:enoyl-CoA hydratase-related protein [Balneolaceae bacterium ANBcel3]